MTDRLPASHAEHDLLLVAAFAAGDLGEADRERAELLASTCAECALLATDLRAIATATAALPPRTRPRDFALSPQDAARLQGRGWRRLLGVLAGPRSAALRPLATGLTTLGIAGLLLAAMPPIQLGGAAAAPAGGGIAPAAAPSGVERDSADGSAAPAPSAAPVKLDSYSAQSAAPNGSPLAVDTAGGDDPAVVPDEAVGAQPEITVPVVRGPSTLAVLSGAFLVLGLGLFGLRWTARRLTDA